MVRSTTHTAQPGKQNADVAPSARKQPSTLQPPPEQSPTDDAAELDQDVSDDKDAHSAAGAPVPASKSESPQALTERGVQEPQSAPARPTTGGPGESKHVGGERPSPTRSDGKQSDRGRASGRPADLGKSDPLQTSPRDRGVPDRDEQSRTQRGRARTYVTPRDEEKDQEPPERQERRRRVDQAAVQRVLQFERERDRRPKEMPHANEGYDIESFAGNGKLERLIEVKGLSGAWTEYGVPMSRSQFRKALKEGPTFWLYVVEFALEPNRARVYAIQDPTEIVDEYWFDGGWREFAKERGGPGVDAAIKKGSHVLIDGGRRGTIGTAPNVWVSLGQSPITLPCGGGAFAYATPNNSPIVSIGVHPCPVSLSMAQHFPIRCVIGTECGSVLSNQVTITTCPADFNCSGGVTVQDIFDFLGTWFARDPRADINGVGGITVQDIFDFLAAWFARCA